MMRVHSKPGQAFPTRALLTALGLFGAACSSTPIETPTASTDEPAPSTGGNQASAGSSSVSGSGSGSATVGGIDFQKQDYPAGPYGVGLGSTLEDFAFLGWRDPVASGYDISKLETVHLSEFYNPDGRTDVKLIWINASAVWCSVCRAEMKDINARDVNAIMRPMGLQMIETLFEDNDYGPARPLDLQKWGQVIDHEIDFPLLLDPGFKLGAFFTSDATPLNLLIRADTMQVIDASMGWSADYWNQVSEQLTEQ
jgi:hypothetical protein